MRNNIPIITSYNLTTLGITDKDELNFVEKFEFSDEILQSEGDKFDIK